MLQLYLLKLLYSAFVYTNNYTRSQASAVCTIPSLLSLLAVEVEVDISVVISLSHILSFSAVAMYNS